MKTTTDKIKNFCIIAHIDHGKSTLADRLLEITGTLSSREMTHGQILDTMEIEQERGITIKLQPVKMNWKGFVLNLIDTPGHVDFSYEVSRSLAACEGAILVVDSTQGIEAQTLANVYSAIDHNLKIIPVVNKIDLPNAYPEVVTQEIIHAFGFEREEILLCSAKTGEGVADILDTIIKDFPEPKMDVNEQATKALIFDAVYDSYRGVLAYVRLMSGSIKKNDKIYLIGTKTQAEALEVGYFAPQYRESKEIYPGDIGYVVTGQKDLKNVRVGDTITVLKDGITPQDVKPLAGYKKVLPVVFAGIFCVENSDFNLLRNALNKLSINDSSLVFEPNKSDALGFGFHCGFLGLLHLEIVQERLEREFDLDLVVTAPSVSYEVVLKSGEVSLISNPSQLPEQTLFTEVREPWVRAEVVLPKEYVGNIMKLMDDSAGIYIKIDYLDEVRTVLHYEIPLRNVISDFYDSLKSLSAGYASFSYTLIGYRACDLIKLDILVSGKVMDSLATIVPRKDAPEIGRRICQKLKTTIPKHLFKVSLQAAISGKIIAREDISSVGKNVTEKLYGGDVTRKNKLLKKQAKGKKRMKQFGNITIPQEAFMSVLKKD